MSFRLQEIRTAIQPEALATSLSGEPGLVLLHSASTDGGQGRFSLLGARPFLTVRCAGHRCEFTSASRTEIRVGDPWNLVGGALAKFATAVTNPLPFPSGGCLGWWGFELPNATEPRTPRRVRRDLELPDAWLGFYDSLVVFDHDAGEAWIVATGLLPDGSRSSQCAHAQVEFWQRRLESACPQPTVLPCPALTAPTWQSSLSRAGFLRCVEHAQRYIRAGDIYQVNLAHRLTVDAAPPAWELFRCLSTESPAPFAAFLNTGDTQLVSSSPELFLRMVGPRVTTRPIKGTRPRGHDDAADALLAAELRASPKENAELLMITDLLRNDLGRVCEFGSVRAPELARLEKFAQVQHLVATVEGDLRREVTHLEALRACFPGGSVTGAPKIRALEIIDELEPVARGPYTGALGYLGFNGLSQFNIAIRTAVCHQGRAYFHAGAGIVADSDPSAEYAETLAKADGFLRALARCPRDQQAVR